MGPQGIPAGLVAVREKGERKKTMTKQTLIFAAIALAAFGFAVSQ